MKDVKYVLTLDEEQAVLVSHACDFLSRIHIGQLKELRWEFLNMHFANGTSSKYVDLMRLVDEKIQELGDLAYPKKMAGKNIAVHESRTADVLYNVHQALRYTLAWQRQPEGGISVDFDEPIQLGSASIPDCFCRTVDWLPEK